MLGRGPGGLGRPKAAPSTIRTNRLPTTPALRGGDPVQWLEPRARRRAPHDVLQLRPHP
jgi:hypothetical protein